MSDALDLIDGIIYADAFDCALTLEEGWRYSRVRVSLAEMREKIARAPLREILGERDGYYFLRGREDLVAQRIERRRRAARLKQRAGSVAQWLQYAPFVRGLVLTGSVAADDAPADADVDMLVIVARDRIGLAFVVLGSLSRLLSRRLFCPNYYVSEAHLVFTRRDYYIARELTQAVPLTETAHALLDANSWVQEQMPNRVAADAPARKLAAGAMVQRLLEAPFRGRFGSWCERRAGRIVASRLVAHYRGFRPAVPPEIEERFANEIELRFHAEPRVDRALERYRIRREQLAYQLKEIASSDNVRA